jgi:HEPN domain-containing protein
MRKLSKDGGHAVTKDDFQRLANERLADARALLAAKRWSLAYDAVGYAVEDGFKACILGRVAADVGLIFEERRFSERCWTHDFEELFRLAGLKTDFDVALTADGELKENWRIVKKWDESSRYARTSKGDAQDLYDAITDKKHGVLTWIKAHY